MSQRSVTRFDTLDLLRGVAALAVVMLHFPHPPQTSPLMPHGYLAVDLFFALSGFVVAHAYGQQLVDGEPVWRFMLRRLVRLYPLYLIVTVVGAFLILDHALPSGGGQARTFDAWLSGLGRNLLFLPTAPDAAGGALFPALYPAWSLFWELAANLLFALLAPRLRWQMLILILMSGLALLVATGWYYGTLDAGPNWRDCWGGAGRVLWGFFAGVAVQRISVRIPAKVKAPATSPWLIAPLLVAALAQPATDWRYDVAAAILFPILVLWGARVRQTSRWGRWFGYISYAVYLVQAPLANLFDRLINTMTQSALKSMPYLVSLPFFIGAVLLVAALLSQYFDDPVRAWLTRTGATFSRRRESVVLRRS